MKTPSSFLCTDRCPKTRKLWWYTTSTATRASRAEIPTEDKLIFTSKLITCSTYLSLPNTHTRNPDPFLPFSRSPLRAVEYHSLSPAAEREVFQRVQLGMSLTTAEKLQAISSPWANYITYLEKTHLTIDGGLVDKISFNDTRGRAFQNTAQLVYCCEGLPGSNRIPTSVKLEKWLMSDDTCPSTAFKDSMADVLRMLWELACTKELDAPFRRFEAKVAPVEFVFIGTPPTLIDFPPPSFLVVKKNRFFWGGHLQACYYTKCATAIPQPNNQVPYSPSDAISAKPTSTCASTRMWPTLAGPSSMRSRMAE